MIHVGDCIEVMRSLEAGSVQTCVTSPPYFGLRSYDESAWMIDPNLPADKREWLDAELRQRGIRGR